MTGVSHAGPAKVAFLSNHGTMGGGEVMLVAMAAASDGVPAQVVGPAAPNDVAVECARLGLPYVDVGGTSRISYLRRLRHWAASVRGGAPPLLWCNGATPSLATAGLRVPRVVHLHHPPPPSQQLPLAYARRNARATVVPSLSMSRLVRSSVVLENWTADFELDAGRSGAVSEGRTFTVGYLGRLSLAKGIDVLAEAVRNLRRDEPPIHFVVAGDYRFVSRAQRQGIAESLEDLSTDVDLVGWIPRQDLFDQVDALVVPSSDPEPFGLSAAEAMAVGVPVLVSNAGALPEVVGPDHPWVFPAGDATALASSLRQLRDDGGRRQASRLAARHRWEERYSPAAGTGRFQDLLSGLLS